MHLLSQFIKELQESLDQDGDTEIELQGYVIDSRGKSVEGIFAVSAYGKGLGKLLIILTEKE